MFILAWLSHTTELNFGEFPKAWEQEILCFYPSVITPVYFSKLITQVVSFTENETQLRLLGMVRISLIVDTLQYLRGWRVRIFALLPSSGKDKPAV